jgi:NADH-quinone oxidoreductase subunit E
MVRDFDKVAAILGRYPATEASLVMVLQDIQAEYRYVPALAMTQVASHLGVPVSRVFAVATFYKIFSLKPEGRTVIQVCTGTACHVRGAPQLEDELCRVLDVRKGGTTADMAYTVKGVNCVGACAMAPVVIVGDKVFGKVKANRIRQIISNDGTVHTIGEQHATSET